MNQNIKFPIRVKLPPCTGESGAATELIIEKNSMAQIIPGNDESDGPCAWFDWYHGRLQIVITEAGSDDPVAIHCFNKDGALNPDRKAWLAERDNHANH
jgi:hypothetical protein